MANATQTEIPSSAKGFCQRVSTRALAYAMLMIVARDLIEIINLPAAGYMKDVLKLGPVGFATVSLFNSVPGYFGPVYGYIRDRWSPFGMGDRGYFVVVGAILAGVCVFIFATPVGYWAFICASVIWTASLLMLYSAISGLQTTLARRYQIAGWMATGVLFAAGTIGALIPLIGGRIADHFAYRQILLPFSAFCLAIGSFGFWRPKVIEAKRPELQTGKRHVAEDLRRLIRHYPFRKALLLSCLWRFSPFSVGIITFLVIDRFGGTMETVGQNESLSALAGLPVILLFGLLATRFDLRRILFVGVAASILQFVPLLFAHNLSGLLVSSFVAGLLGDLVETALLDLKMRSCPEGLEGLSLSLIGLAMLLMAGASIWLGAQVFQRDGIVPLVFLAGFGSLVMLPFIWRLPKSVASVQ